jgi:accessory gene regulator B
MKQVISQEDTQAYNYGFELLLSTLVNGILIFTAAIFMGVFLHTLFFLAGFVPLRLTAGGYHAKRHWSCIFVTSLAYTISAYAVRYIPIDSMPLYSLICCIFVSMTVWMLSPVEADNKPLTEKKREIVRNWSIGIVSFDLIVGLLVAFVAMPNIIPYLSFYVTGAVVAGISLIAAQKRQKKSAKLKRMLLH